MNKPTIQQIIDCTDNQLIADWIAVHVRDWNKETDEHSQSDHYYDTNGFLVMSCQSWQPCEPTEKGRNQAFVLMFKFNVIPEYFVKSGLCGR